MVAVQPDVSVGRPQRIRITEGFRLLEVTYEPGLRVPPHYHETSNLTIVLQGRIREAAGRSENHWGPGSVVVKPAGTVHENEFGPTGARTFVIELPQPGAAGGAIEPLAHLGYTWRPPGPWVRSLVDLVDSLRSGRAPIGIAEELLHVGSLLREGGSPSAGEIRPATWLRDVRDRLHERTAETVRVGDLADAAGVHPVHLARSFRRCFGTTVARYRHGVRVRRAAEALAGSRASLAEIAIELGFCDQAHFCRVFKALTGLTPGRFRRTVGRSGRSTGRLDSFNTGRR